MDMDLFNLLAPLGGALGLGLLSLLFYGLKKLAKKTDMEWDDRTVMRAEDAARKAYLEVKQVFVDNAKDRNRDNKLGVKEAKLAKQKAIDHAKSYLGPKGLRQLGDVLGAGELVDSFLGTEIEANVAADSHTKKR